MKHSVVLVTEDLLMWKLKSRERPVPVPMVCVDLSQDRVMPLFRALTREEDVQTQTTLEALTAALKAADPILLQDFVPYSLILPASAAQQ